MCVPSTCARASAAGSSTRFPHPGEAGHETWPSDAWQRIGAANNWAGMAVDEARGLVFVPTGSAAFDFWGGNRHGANLYANSLLALRADTGERVWHFQFVHHDLWDRDLPTAPVLGTVTKAGRIVDVVMQATKTGELYVFERETGTPLWPDRGSPGAADHAEGRAVVADAATFDTAADRAAGVL